MPAPSPYVSLPCPHQDPRCLGFITLPGGRATVSELKSNPVVTGVPVAWRLAIAYCPPCPAGRRAILSVEAALVFRNQVIREPARLRFSVEASALASVVRRHSKRLPTRVLVVGCGNGEQAAQLAIS